jgi:hypothetical protein
MSFRAWAIRSGPRSPAVRTTRQTVNVGMTSSLFGSGWRKYSLRPLSRSGWSGPVKDKNPARPNHADFMACDYNIELWHKSVKQHLGFEDVATHTFDAVVSHVHWVYCAYILLHMSPPGLSPESQSVGDRQRALQQGLADQEKRHILQKLTQIGGVQRYKDELRQALADA